MIICTTRGVNNGLLTLMLWPLTNFRYVVVMWKYEGRIWFHNARCEMEKVWHSEVLKSARHARVEEKRDNT